ncbi:DnaJ domain protein [Cyanobium sp. PCC 7001]|uniref:J domain-containing protein n=1 Tax=Cyanobium sp. PCC 7001 TaxID=180281 RepID=UPI0001804C33|nr:J domain-containing protein [Cyanobium sp. PCC 7001]EDY37896.1 DnaJ domain protein [Cyanobium sp. PCC 7001]
MAPSPGPSAQPRSPQPRTSQALKERQLLGWLSLLLALVLCGLIVMRARQAARDGNRELQNDTYWVLVSPVAFSILGVLLLRPSRQRPGSSAGPRLGFGATAAAARSGLDRSSAEAAAATAQLQHLEQSSQRQVQMARSEAEAARAAAQASQQELERVSAGASEAIAVLEARLLQAERERDQAFSQVQDLSSSPTGTSDDPALRAAERAQRRAETLLAGLQDELQQARTLLASLSSGQPESLVQSRRQAALALEAAQSACREVERLQALQEQQLGEARLLLERCAQVEQGDLATVRREVEQALAAARSARQEASDLADAATTRMERLSQDIQQAQQASQAAAQQLGQVLHQADQMRQDTRQRADEQERRLDELVAQVDAELKQARERNAAARRSSEEALQLVDRLEQVVFAYPPAAGMPAATAPGRTPEDPAYRDACGELGVVPGSPWQQVRAAWRRNLLQWHPDQGGDPNLWSRRQAAYQLLEAWYAFKGEP